MMNCTKLIETMQDYQDHAEGKCQCINPTQCALAMAREIVIVAQKIKEEAYTPAQQARANGETWLK